MGAIARTKNGATGRSKPRRCAPIRTSLWLLKCSRRLRRQSRLPSNNAFRMKYTGALAARMSRRGQVKPDMKRRKGVRARLRTDQGPYLSSTLPCTTAAGRHARESNGRSAPRSMDLQPSSMESAENDTISDSDIVRQAGAQLAFFPPLSQPHGQISSQALDSVTECLPAEERESAVLRVFRIPELFELIIENLHACKILAIRRVEREWNNIVEGSSKLQTIIRRYNQPLAAQSTCSLFGTKAFANKYSKKEHFDPYLDVEPDWKVHFGKFGHDSPTNISRFLIDLMHGGKCTVQCFSIPNMNMQQLVIRFPGPIPHHLKVGFDSGRNVEYELSQRVLTHPPCTKGWLIDRHGVPIRMISRKAGLTFECIRNRGRPLRGKHEESEVRGMTIIARLTLSTQIKIFRARATYLAALHRDAVPDAQRSYSSTQISATNTAIMREHGEALHSS